MLSRIQLSDLIQLFLERQAIVPGTQLVKVSTQCGYPFELVTSVYDIIWPNNLIVHKSSITTLTTRGAELRHIN